MRKTLKVLLVMMILFTTIMASKISYAYFAEGVYGNNSDNTTTIVIGTWDFYESWRPDVFYFPGDLVSHNGVTYIALRPNMNKMPGRPGSLRFWHIY